MKTAKTDLSESGPTSGRSVQFQETPAADRAQPLSAAEARARELRYLKKQEKKREKKKKRAAELARSRRYLNHDDEREEAAKDAVYRARQDALIEIKELLDYQRDLRKEIEESPPGQGKAAELARIKRAISDYKKSRLSLELHNVNDALESHRARLQKANEKPAEQRDATQLERLERKLLELEHLKSLLEEPAAQRDAAQEQALEQALVDFEEWRLSLQLRRVDYQLEHARAQLRKAKERPTEQRDTAEEKRLELEESELEGSKLSLEEHLEPLLVEIKRRERDRDKANARLQRQQDEEAYRKRLAMRMSLQQGGSAAYSNVQVSPKNQTSGTLHAGTSTLLPTRSLRRVEHKLGNVDPAPAQTSQPFQQRSPQQQPPHQRSLQRRSPEQRPTQQQQAQQGVPQRRVSIPRPRPRTPLEGASTGSSPKLRRVKKTLDGQPSRQSSPRPGGSKYPAGGRE